MDSVNCYKEVKKEKGCQEEVNLSRRWVLLEDQSGKQWGQSPETVSAE